MNNQEEMDQTVAAIKRVERGLIFTNLIFFDMEYGYRLDVSGFAGLWSDLTLPFLLF